jgi:rubrerythrin
MRNMTEQSAKDALSGESQAHIRYQVFSEKASAESLPNVARAFKASSFSEMIHAASHLKILAGVGTTAENLASAVLGENFEVEEMYPAYIKVAELQEEKAAGISFIRALVAEKVHAAIFKKAKDAIEKGGDLDPTPIHVCTVCGFTMEGVAPEICPVCGTPKEKFVTF